MISYYILKFKKKIYIHLHQDEYMNIETKCRILQIDALKY